MKKISLLFGILAMFLVFGSTVNATTNPTPSIPVVVSPTATVVTQTSATLGANVTSLGFPTTPSYGSFYYGKTPRPGAPVTGTVPLTSIGSYSTQVSSLTCGTQYYFYGAVSNSTGTGYTPDGTFTTSPCATTITMSNFTATTPYTKQPNTGMSFAYTTPTVSSGTVQCKLLDSNLADKTIYSTANPILYGNIPSVNGVYTYYIKCQSMTDGTVTKTSNPIILNIATSSTCPQISQPAPTFCPNGKVEAVTNSTGCITSYKCVTSVAEGISVKKAPNKVKYKVGELLDLTGLVVEVRKSDKTPIEVAYVKSTETTTNPFTIHGITTSKANGAMLTEKDTKITIMIGKNIKTTQDITVLQDYACVRPQVAKREASVKTVSDAYSTTMSSSLTKRTTAIVTAWTIDNVTQRNSALKVAWDTFKAEQRVARTTRSNGIKAAWTQWKADLKTCKVTPNLENQSLDLL